MKNRLFYVPAVITWVFLCSGCSDTSAPEAVSVMEVNIELTDSVAEEGYLRAEVRVKNVGAESVDYFQGCESPVYVSLIDQDGNELRLRGPSLPKCAPQWQELQSSRSIETGVDLIWAWDESGTPYPIPPGIYMFNASFSYYMDPGGDPLSVTKKLQVELK